MIIRQLFDSTSGTYTYLLASLRCSALEVPASILVSADQVIEWATMPLSGPILPFAALHQLDRYWGIADTIFASIDTTSLPTIKSVRSRP